MQDNDTEVFQISSHAGARELCYPYQGKFYSWDNSSGSIELGNGKVVEYAPINSTSYGEPAGIFGINCGHYPIPIIPGVTIPHGADNIETEEANKETYALTQQQRMLERKVREAKRVVEMEGSLATDEQKQAVRAAQKASADFASANGLSRRLDREQISSTEPQRKNATAQISVLNQLAGGVKPPAEYDNDFREFNSLTLTDKEKTVLNNLKSLSDKSGYEYAAVIVDGKVERPVTNKLENTVGIETGKYNGKLTIFHSHTNGSVPTDQDLRLFTKQNVEKIGAISYNGDTFVISRGVGDTPTEDEFDKAVFEITEEANIAAMSEQKFADMSLGERTYIAGRMQLRMIANYYGWEVEGGRL